MPVAKGKSEEVNWWGAMGMAVVTILKPNRLMPKKFGIICYGRFTFFAMQKSILQILPVKLEWVSYLIGANVNPEDWLATIFLLNDAKAEHNSPMIVI